MIKFDLEELTREMQIWIEENQLYDSILYNWRKSIIFENQSDASAFSIRFGILPSDEINHNND